MKCLDATYVVYSATYPYLPCYVCDSLAELSLYLGCTRSYLNLCLAHDLTCCGREVKVFYGLDKMDD